MPARLGTGPERAESRLTEFAARLDDGLVDRSAPRLAMWSTQDPLTVFGAGQSNVGWEEVRDVFRWLATRFFNCTDSRYELVAAGASGDLAYTLGYEHSSFSMDGGPVQPATLRVTHVYRRENGEWKIVHRHADPPPIEKSPSTT